MKNILFLYENWFDVATVSASSAHADYPVINIQNAWLTWAWRSTSVVNQWVKWDHGQAKAIKAFVLKHHNFSGGSLRVQANDEDSWGGTLPVDVELLASDLTYFWETAQNWQWWRIDLANITTEDSYLKIGRIYSGPSWSPVVNFDDVHSRRLVDLSEKRYSTGGQMTSVAKPKRKVLRYRFSNIESPDDEMFESIYWDYVGEGVSYFLCQDPDKKDKTTMYVENIAEWEIVHRTQDKYFSLDIVVQECL